jgi:hypothetical protein
MSLVEWFKASCPEEQISARPKPRLAIVNRAPSRDEFASWRDDPTTKFVMAALIRNADECREEWIRSSWSTGEANQMTLVGLRERADALLGFTADYEAFCETLNLEPEEERQA